jgi:Ser/Thr protein kinase RdoA (MazF antagonist)
MKPPQTAHAQAETILAHWPLGQVALRPIDMGHINTTFVVEGGPTPYVLQRLNPIFSPQVHLDIDRITAHLTERGLATPRLVPTSADSLWCTDDAGGVWRLQTYMPGQVVTQAKDAAMCHAAGAYLGRFHRALSDLTYSFAAQRLGVHDTARHVAGLEAALVQHRHHAAYDQVAPLGEALLAAADKLPSVAALRGRIVHGDPKISNFIFAPDGAVSCLIDLDTLGEMAVPLELGDAFRSWCNPNGEGPDPSTFRLDWFTAGLRGYALGAGGLLGDDEVALLPAAVQIIAVELACRFCRDALEERYFGWDRQRYKAAWQHNLVRARSQWGLACAYIEVQAQAADAVAEAFGQAV